jgi:hypothetical protein
MGPEYETKTESQAEI